MSTKCNVFGLLLFVISLNNVHSNIFFTDLALPTSQLDKCCKSCNESYKASNELAIFGEALSTEAESCARGCRFFSIAEMLSDRDVKVAADACHGCCDDSYLDSKRKSCNHGCNIMSKLIAEPVFVSSHSFSLSIFIDGGENSEEQGPQSAGDIEMDDVLTDPALRNQLSVNVIDDSKLPEMKVKTLPIDTDKMDELIIGDQSASTSSSSDCLWWLRDFLQMNHVPPCVFAAILILLIIILLRFLISCDVRRNVITSSSFIDDDTSLTKSVLSSPSKTMPVAILLENEKDGFNIVTPNVHKMPPPKYDEAMMCDKNETVEDLAAKNLSSSSALAQSV